MFRHPNQAPDSRDSWIGTIEITRNAFQTTLTPMAVFSRRRGRLIQANDAFFSAFKLDRGMSIGRTLSELGLLSEKDHDSAMLVIHENGVVRDHELCFTRSDGAEAWVLWSAELIGYEAKECYFSVFLDFTRRKLAEKALQRSIERADDRNRQLERAIEIANRYAAKADEASFAKSAFLAHTSHELRTPLNAIVGFTEMLLDDDLTAGQRHALKMIEFSADNLLSLIDNILDLSKIEAHRVELEEVPFNLEELVFQTIEQVRAKTLADDVEILCDLSGMCCEVIGDPARLRQILTNILSNAAKHTREGHILVRGRELELDSDRIHLEFQIDDTGAGIPANMLASIFEPFVQTDATEARRSKGTGLGLAISKHLVTLMGGRISVTSELNVGSVFRFDAWLRRQHSSRDLSAWVVDRNHLANKAVLVLDDNPASLAITADVLHRANAVVLCASKLEDATQILAFGPMDLALVDFSLKGIDAEELPRTLRRAAGERRVPMLALMTEGRLGRRARGGYDGYLTKPIRMKSLVSAVNRVFNVGNEGDKTPATVTQATEPFVKLSILVAEDHVVNQHMMVQILEKMGHDVAVAGDGQAAIKMASTGGFDLIFMDVQMPVMNGIQATEALRRQGVTMPIVALTAIAMKGDMERILASGMNDYIAKPVKQHMLQEVIQRHFGTGPLQDIYNRTRTLVISRDEAAVTVVQQAMQSMLPGISIRVAASTVEGYVRIGSIKPNLLFVDLGNPGVDSKQLVDFLQFEEQYTTLSLVVMVEPETPDDALEHLFLFPNVAVIYKPFDVESLVGQVEHLVSSNIGVPVGSDPAVVVIERAEPTVEPSLPSVEQLARQLGIDRDDYEFLLGVYVESNAENLAAIGVSIAAGDATDVHARAHSIHGSSANLGLREMALRAHAIEELAAAGDMKAAADELVGLTRAFSTVSKFACGS